MGRPIYIELISRINLDELFSTTTKDRIMKFIVQDYEGLLNHKFPACSKAAGTVIENTLTILDMDGVGFSLLSGQAKTFLEIATNLGQNYYPEILGQMWLINTSFLFSTAWAIVKGFIDEKTRSKIIVERSGYADKLLELVDADNLPAFLGGKCTCSHVDGGCLYSDAGLWQTKDGHEIQSGI